MPTTKEYILHEYADIFRGIGTLPVGPYHIRLKESYKPVQHPPRSVPLGMQSAYKAELNRLVKEGIITEVHDHTEWINSIVPVMKEDGSLRLCLDPKDLNIVIHGPTENTHEGTVLILCETARLNNLSLNSKKIQFKSTDCKFFGHRLTLDGIKVDPKKIEVIIQMDPPQNVANLQSLNGMINYLKKFSPVLSEPQSHSGDYASLGSNEHGSQSNKRHSKPSNK